MRNCICVDLRSYPRGAKRSASKNMDKKFLEKMKARLLEEKATLDKELAGITKKDPHAKGERAARFPNLGSELEDNAAEVALYSDRLSLEGGLEGQLANVKRALAAIADGTYGKCKVDGKPIPKKRLEVFPAARTCIKHAATVK